MILIMGNPKAPFSIATTPSYRGGRYSFPWIVPLYPWSSPYRAECLARRHQVPFFESLVWLDPGLNPSFPDHWRTLYSLVQWHGILEFKFTYYDVAVLKIIKLCANKWTGTTRLKIKLPTNYSFKNYYFVADKGVNKRIKHRSTSQ